MMDSNLVVCLLQLCNIIESFVSAQGVIVVIPGLHHTDVKCALSQIKHTLLAKNEL